MRGINKAFELPGQAPPEEAMAEAKMLLSSECRAVCQRCCGCHASLTVSGVLCGARRDLARSECSSNDVAGLKQCLDAGVDPCAANGIGQSGLHVSCIWGNHRHLWRGLCRIDNLYGRHAW